MSMDDRSRSALRLIARVGVFCLMACLAGRTAWAQSPNVRLGEVPQGGLALGAGLAQVNPGYVGFHSRTDVFPIISYRTGRFFLAGPTAGVVATQGDSYTLSFVLRPQLNRLRSSDSPEFAGLSSRQWTVDGGMNLSWRHSWGDLSLGAFHDLLDRNNGTEARMGYSYGIPLGRGRLTPGVGLTWQSANLTNYYYGVSPAEARSWRPAYSPGSALNPSVRLDYSWVVAKRWMLVAGGSYTGFDHSIRNSPLVDESGTAAFMISVARIFPGK